MAESQLANEYSTIIRTLREGNLAWIADEIEQAIESPGEMPEGREPPETGRQGGKTWVALETIQALVVGAISAWDSALPMLRDATQDKELQLQVVDEEVSQGVISFSPQVREWVRQLDGLIRRYMESAG